MKPNIMQQTIQKTTTITPPYQPPYQKVKTTRVAIEPDVKTEPPQKVYETKKVIFRTYQVVWYVLGVIEVILAFRVILKMLGANPFSAFTAFIYAVSDPFALPFAGIFGVTVSATTGALVEWSTLVGMIVYLIFAWGIVQFFQLVKPTTPEEVEETVDTQ